MLYRLRYPCFHLWFCRSRNLCSSTRTPFYFLFSHLRHEYQMPMHSSKNPIKRLRNSEFQKVILICNTAEGLTRRYKGHHGQPWRFAVRSYSIWITDISWPFCAISPVKCKDSIFRYSRTGSFDMSFESSAVILPSDDVKLMKLIGFSPHQ
jgi:hypothetical protein